MKKNRVILFIISLCLIIIPFFINFISIYKLVSVCLGIILLDISFCIGKNTSTFLKNKFNILIVIIMPIILLFIVYGIDFLKIKILELKPIFVIENKINDKVSIYNSLLYRVFDCNEEYYFDYNFENDFICDTDLLKNIDINNLLSDIYISYQNYSKDFIKISGKISKIAGNTIELASYKETDTSLNGYVEFDNNKRLIISLNNIDTSNYKIYDYITVVGILSNYDDSNLYLTGAIVVDTDLYSNYEINVIESSNCDNNLIKYTDNYYLGCLENIYLVYDIGVYELSYALKDKKVYFEDIINEYNKSEDYEFEVYELEKFNILVCSENKTLFLNKDIKLDYSLCE